MKILLIRHACLLHIDARLNERRTGLLVNMFNDLVRSDPLHIRPEHGESFLEQMERLRSFMDEIGARYPHGVVLPTSV